MGQLKIRFSEQIDTPGLSGCENLPTASVALASAAPIRRIFSPSALAASTVLVLATSFDSEMWRLTGEMLPLTLSNCLHFVSFGLCWEFDLGLRVTILDG